MSVLVGLAAFTAATTVEISIDVEVAVDVWILNLVLVSIDI